LLPQAVEFVDGFQSWYIDGIQHREDGPARIFSTGRKDWFIEGRYIKKENFEEEIKIYKLSKICR
jgi:hypothetical protein